MHGFSTQALNYILEPIVTKYSSQNLNPWHLSKKIILLCKLKKVNLFILNYDVWWFFC